MNQLEQFREQCAAVCDEAKKNISPDCIIGEDVRNAGIACCENIAKRIRALPLSEIEQKPVAWMYHDGQQQFPIPDPRMGTVLMSLTRYVYRNEIALYASPETEALRKENEQLKESLRYVIEQAIEWQNFATGCEQEETKEMKLAKENAK